MYSERIMEEFYNPQNYGVIKGASGVGKVVSDIGSEIIKIYISKQLILHKMQSLNFGKTE